MKTKELNKLAMNTKDLNDKVIYRGFIDEKLDSNIEYDFDETMVMLSPLGSYLASTSDGKLITETIDDESLDLILNQPTQEILLDKDHSSEKSGLDKNTQAMGWISKLKVLKDVGDMSGLYGVIKWCKDGIQLVKDRAYRFLSPTFECDMNGHVIGLKSVALTNLPNFKQMPSIINAETKDNDKLTTNILAKDIIMTKEEVIEIIKELMPKTEKVEEVETEEVKTEEGINEEVETEKVETKEEVKTEEVKTEISKDEIKELIKEVLAETKDVKKEQEVIKIEALNSVAAVNSKVEAIDLDADFTWHRCS